MSGGVQITIPDLDDDDYGGSTSLGFGKQDNPFARAFANDSPTSATTPLTAFGHSINSERNPFQSHSRNESITSQDSANSIGVSTTARYAALTHSNTPNRTTFHSSQSSIAVSSQSPFSIPKKSSFASIRNAFKSGVKGGNSFNTNDPPPVPPLSDAYPLFNRSTSSLSRITTSAFQRPPTPTSKSSKHRAAHSYARSHHSQNGSIFHISDGGSDQQHSMSPPPVPRMPAGVNFGQFGALGGEFEETNDKVVMDPKTPSDYALHAVFMRFAAAAEERINLFLKESLDADPPLQDFMGPEIHAALDDSLNALGKIAQKHAKPVVDSIMRWRRSQNEGISSDILRIHTMQATSMSLSLSRSRSQSQSNSHAVDIPAVLNERKSLASIYITCRALVIVLKALDGIRDGLSDALGYSLEESAFEGFRKPVGLKSANHRVCAEMYAVLLGTLAGVSSGVGSGSGGRFVSVTDRMISELDNMTSAIGKDGGGGKGDKEAEAKVENLVRGIRFVKIKVWPTERFVEGAEFMEMFAKAYVNAHGSKLKTVFVDTLLHLLHPIGKTAQVETNDPTWRKAIEYIYPRALAMSSKPRYWAIAFPLVVTSLCVAPQDMFLKHWWSCVEACLGKLKEKSQRIVIMNALLRLVWTYLYRCQESLSSTTTRLEGLLRHLFPPGRTSIGLGEESVPILGYLVHFILSRHWEFGRDLLLDLMQESSSKEKETGIPAPERTQIAAQAFLLSLSLIEREELKPSWPSNLDFSVTPDPSDYPATPDFPPQSVFAKSAVKDLFERLGSTLISTTQGVVKSVGGMNVLDDQWTWSRSHMVYEEPHSYVTRRHEDGHAVAYPNALVPQISLLHTGFSTWPRLLHPNLGTAEAVDMLLKGVLHVEPLVATSASEALRRFMGDEEKATIVMRRSAAFLCTPKIGPGLGTKSIVDCSKLLSLWVELLDKWARDFKKVADNDVEGIIEEGKVKMAQEIEACALFLLSHQKDAVRSAGVAAIRILGLLSSPPSDESLIEEKCGAGFWLVQSLHHEGFKRLALDGLEEMLSSKEAEYLAHYRTLNKPDILLRIADSRAETDRSLWKHLYPVFLQSVEVPPSPFSTLPNTTTICREAVVAATTRYIPFISHIAGLSSRAPAGLAGRPQQGHEKDSTHNNQPLMDQWYAWVKILCGTSLPPEARPIVPNGREHSRAPSDSNAMFEKEKLTTTRGLFRYLTPFLDSEYEFFRDAAVCCVSSTPSSSYPQLLEDLGLLANRQFHEDPRLKSTSTDDLRMGRIAVERSRRHERLRVAVTRIYFLTAHHLRQQRSMGKQTALSHVLKFVRNAQIFLCTPDVRDNHTLQKLRRYFCGVVEQLFDGLASLSDSGRFIQPNMHLTLYRLCEEWCQHGPHKDGVKRRLISMQRAAAVSSEEDRSDAVERFQKETLALSEAAVGALSSLCQKPLFTTELSSISPTDKFPAEYTAALTPGAVLERLCAILSSIKPNVRTKGQKALRFLLTAELEDKALFSETLSHATVLEGQTDTSNSLCFEVVTEIVRKDEPHGFTFAQLIYLGLVNLCHVSPTIRQLAFGVLHAAHQSESAIPMSQFEAPIRSLAPSVYGHAHSLISDFLSKEHPRQAIPFLAQLNTSLPLLAPTSSSKDQTLLLLLQSLEFWITEIDLMDDDKTGISHQGVVALYHLMSLTLRYGESHPEQVIALWSKLVEHHQSNALATVRFLVEQSHKVGSTIFIKCAANIVACLCNTAPGASVFEELCSIIEPAQMLPVIEHKLAFPEPQDMELWSNLDALFAEQPRLSLGAAQFAWLFLVEVSLERAWDFRTQLPILLHTIFTHFDSRIGFVRQQARRLLFQVLRSWVVGYDENFSDRAEVPNAYDCFRIIDELEVQGESLFWKEEDSTTETEQKMKNLCEQVLALLGPLCPRLEDKWGSLALEWGTSCSIRATAFRSLQIFRSIVSRPTKSDLALLLGRLSNTIAGTNSSIQSFTSEILLTLKTLTIREDLDASLLPQLFWCSCACLETPVEVEFEQALQLLAALLERIDLDNEAIANSLISSRPFDWEGSDVLQPMLLKGLRSSKTSNLTWQIMRKLSSAADNRLIDTTEGRLRDLYIAALPTCLYVMANPECEQAAMMRSFAENIGRLARQEHRESIARIMISFSKSHFRTKDDFLRQSANSLREHYGGDYWREMTTLLLGLVLNDQKWLRTETMNVLKVVFQLHPTKQVGSELLMPLLRLLNTDLTSQALEVLEEPLGISGGPAAKHVLRMSMLHGALNSPAEADVFGVPEESGWSVPKADALREMCRANVMSVFDTCSLPSTRPSRIDFEPEMDFHQFTHGHDHELAVPEQENPTSGGGEEDIGGLVKRLHALTSYFQSPVEPQTPLPTQRLEARVAAILAKSSTSERDIPQTPFLDAFRVGGEESSDDFDDDDDDTDEDEEDDAFIFDSPSAFRTNGYGRS